MTNTQQNKYAILAADLEEDLQEYENALWSIDEVVEDAQRISDDFRSAAASEDPDDLQTAIDNSSNINAKELGDALLEKERYEESIPKLVQRLLVLDKQFDIRYKDSEVIDILKCNKQLVSKLGIDIPKAPKKKKK